MPATFLPYVHEPEPSLPAALAPGNLDKLSVAVVSGRFPQLGEEAPMPKFTRAELEEGFRTYWRAGAVGEDWDAWADLFTEDCRYFEHFYGPMRGRETVRAWIKPVMEKYGEIYTAYEWHVIDEDSGRVVFYMQDRQIGRAS